MREKAMVNLILLQFDFINCTAGDDRGLSFDRCSQYELWRQTTNPPSPTTHIRKHAVPNYWLIRLPAEPIRHPGPAGIPLPLQNDLAADNILLGVTQQNKIIIFSGINPEGGRKKTSPVNETVDAVILYY